VQNILINFTADPAGLQPGIDGLVQLGAVDKELAEQVKKTSTELDRQGTTAANAAKSASSEVSKLSGYFKNLDKSIVGGAYSKTLKDLDKAVTGTSEKFKALTLAVDVAKKKLSELDPKSEEWGQLNEQIVEGESVLHSFGEEVKKTETQTQSFKTRLLELKSELQKLEEAGDGNTKKFEELSVEAAKLQDQIDKTNERIRNLASSTGNFDALLGSLRAIASGFEIGAGASALFGSENEDVERALVKLNAVMAISNGLREIQESLKAQGIIRLKAEALGQTVLATSTKLTAGAFSLMGIAVEASSVAFKVLRTAIITTGIGAIVVAIGFLVEKLSALGEETRKAKGEMESFNSTLEFQKSVLDDLIHSIDKQTKLRIQFAKESGKSDKDLVDITVEGLQTQRKASEDYTAARIADLKKIDGVHVGSIENALDAQKALDDVNQKVASVGGGEELDKESTRRVQKTKSLLEQIVAGYKGAADAQDTIDLERATFVASLYGQNLKSAKGFADASVLISKQGSKAELNAKIEALKAQRAVELSDPNLLPGERTRIEADTQRQISDLRFEFARKDIENAKRGVDAKVLLAKEGSKEEFDFKLESLRLSQDLELKDKELTENKKAEIDARYQKQRSDLTKAFNKKVAEDTINSRISELNITNSSLSLNADAATNAQLLENKKQLVDEEAALEVLSIIDSEKNEELRRVKIKAVYAKALADKEQLERDKIKADIDVASAESESINNREIAKNKNILESEKSTGKQRRQAQEDLFLFMQANIDATQRANEAAYAAGLESFEQYMQKKREIQTQQDDLDLQREQVHQNQLKQIRDLASQTAINLTSFAFNIAKKGYAEEEQKVKDLYDQKRISETEYNNRLKEIRTKQAQDEKAQALFTTLVQQGPTVLKGFQQGGFAGAAAAFTLFFALLSAVTSAEVPKFKEGKVRIKGTGTDTSDSIPAMISNDESVIRAAMSRKHEAALRAINEDRYHEYLVTHELPKYYQNMSMSDVPEHVHTMTEAEKIDYDKLGEVIAQKLAENPHHTLSFDERGFTLSIQEGLATTEYKNKKLNT
jgi:hypothetical protein